MLISNLLLDELCNKTRICLKDEIGRLTKMIWCIIDRVLKIENCKISDVKMLKNAYTQYI